MNDTTTVTRNEQASRTDAPTRTEVGQGSDAALMPLVAVRTRPRTMSSFAPRKNALSRSERRQ